MNHNKNLFTGPLAWMTENAVAANLLMLFLLVGGAYWGMSIKQEVFPEFELDRVNISVAYPGASPEEIEQGILLPVEEAIAEVDGIAEFTSDANEGSGTVTVEALIDADLQQLASDLKNQVDRISTFPEEAEEPLVTLATRKRKVITMLIYGDLPREVLREVTEQVRDKILQAPEISQVELLGERPLEIGIEVSAEVLRAYNLTLAQIAAKIRDSSLDLAGGSLKTEGGEILVRLKERRDYKEQFAKVPVVSTAGGAMVTLGEIAQISDGFAETDQFQTFNGKPALGVKVYRVGDQTPVSIATTVERIKEELQTTLPAGVQVDTVDDRSQLFVQRRDLLVKNGLLGLVLVFCLLGLFLEARLAFWVSLGIPVSFLGGLLIIPWLGVSINIVSLFAFIVSLGIVVDDTIIIGENVYRYRQEGAGFFEAAVRGVKEMAMPVTFSVLTNIITFMPLYFVPGTMGKIFRNIPVVVASVFFISLIEALFVLPAHLGHQKELKNPILLFFTNLQQRFSNGFTSLVKTLYAPFLRFSLRFRYVFITTGVVILWTAIVFVQSGRMGMTPFPRLESDLAYASVVLPVGVPVEETMAAHDRMMQGAEQVLEEIGRDQQTTGILSFVNKNSAWIQVYMVPSKERAVSTSEFTSRWRKLVGGIPGVENLKFQSDFGGPGHGAAVTVELQHRDTDILEMASSELAEALSYFPIVSDIDDGFNEGKQQFDFRLKAEGYRLGLSPLDIARQIRNAFYGHEVLTQLRGRNEIKVMVRSPEEEREAEYYLDEMLVSTPAGVKVPLSSVAEVSRGTAFTDIHRRDGRRVVTVSCDVTPQNKAGMVLDSVKEETLPVLMAKYPGLSYSFEGKQSDIKKSLGALKDGMLLALVIIYVVLAIPFKSYIQPMIIMLSIPFGVVGAIIGHMIMGYSLSIPSMFGIVALSGVVVNDSLILIDCANRMVRDGTTHYAAVVKAGVQRFRPIMLTTLTTFGGLLPMIFETSRQAKFLIPMAISLGFGILFSTLIILVMVPALYMIIEDIKKGFRFIFC